jgi:hypothetical protein
VDCDHVPLLVEAKLLDHLSERLHHAPLLVEDVEGVDPGADVGTEQTWYDAVRSTAGVDGVADEVFERPTWLWPRQGPRSRR